MAKCTLRVESLELTKAHDGLFRGLPEPVILVALYRIEGDEVRSLLCERLSFKVDAESPSPLPWTHDPWVYELSGGAQLAIVVVAMEEDSGDDIARLETTLQNPAGLNIWRLDEDTKERASLAEAGAADDAGHPSPIDIEGSTGALSVSCSWDKWVGASLWVEAAPHDEIVRDARLRSLLGRNDWTLSVRSRVD